MHLENTEISFECVYNKYYSNIYRYIFKRLRNVHETEDLTNEVFYSCLKNWDKYDSQKASIISWLYTITNNRLKNHYRDKKVVVSLNDEDNPISLPCEDDFNSAINLTETRKLLADALCCLSERERKIIILKYFNELTSDEIAHIMSLSAVNVRVIVNRSLQKLMNYFKKNNISWEL